MKTTLNQIREKSPCADGWKKLLAHLGKTTADDEALSIITILDSNGLDDALWCLQAVEGHDREIRLYAVWSARQVQHLMTDQKSIDALDVAERFANGLATDSELAAWDAAGAARASARAARAAARAAAWDAAGAAAWDAAWDAAGVDAGDAARAAAWDAAWVAARSAAGAARDAGDAAWDAQEKRLRELCAEIDAAIAQQTKETK